MQENNMYTWFTKSYRGINTKTGIQSVIYQEDVIGIDVTGEELIHDNMVFGLEQLKKMDRLENFNFGNPVGIKKAKVLYLIYKIGGDQPNLFYNEKHNTLYYKYVEDKNSNMNFDHIGYNGAEYRIRSS